MATDVARIAFAVERLAAQNSAIPNLQMNIAQIQHTLGLPGPPQEITATAALETSSVVPSVPTSSTTMAPAYFPASTTLPIYAMPLNSTATADTMSGVTLPAYMEISGELLPRSRRLEMPTGETSASGYSPPREERPSEYSASGLQLYGLPSNVFPYRFPSTASPTGNTTPPLWNNPLLPSGAGSMLEFLKQDQGPQASQLRVEPQIFTGAASQDVRIWVYST